MARQYVKRNVDESQFIVYDNIINGVILTKFNEEDGVPIVNYKFFVSHSDFDAEYSSIKFKIPTSERENWIVARGLDEINHQLNNHGIIEDSSRNLKELNGTFSNRDIFHEMVVNQDFTFDKATEKDEDFEFSPCEDAFHFVQSLVPILKKVIAQTREDN